MSKGKQPRLFIKVLKFFLIIKINLNQYNLNLGLEAAIF